MIANNCKVGGQDMSIYWNRKTTTPETAVREKPVFGDKAEIIDEQNGKITMYVPTYFSFPEDEHQARETLAALLES